MLRTLKKPGRKEGINRVAWDLRADPPPQRKDEQERREFGGPAGGPSVLPGTYTVRLTVDGESFEQPVEVEIDPALEVTADELAAAHRMAGRLAALQGSVNRALRGLDGVTAQLGERRATAEAMKHELPPELVEAGEERAEEAEELAARLARPEGKPFWSQGPRLIERLGDLFGNVDRAFGAPTAAQRTYLAELEQETAAALADVDRFFTETLVAFNAELAEHGVPPLLLPAAIQPAPGNEPADAP